MARKVIIALTAAAAFSVGSALLAGAALGADPAAAPMTPGGKAAVARQASYRQLNDAFAALGDDLKKDAPDRVAVAAGAARLKAMAADLPSWFPRGSGPEAGVKTRAKAEIWTDAEGFATAANRLRDETAKLQEVAAVGDLEGARGQRRVAAAACKACHDRFRESDKN